MSKTVRVLALVMSWVLTSLCAPQATFASHLTQQSPRCLDAHILAERHIFEPAETDAIVSQLTWSPDGTSLSASYVFDIRSERILLWNIASGEQSVVFRSLDEPYAVTGSWTVWSPDSSKLALNSNGNVRIVTIEDDDTIVSLESNPVGVARLVWSPDGSQLATIEGGTEGNYRIRVWDSDTGQQERELVTHGLIPDLWAVWTDEGLRWLTLDTDQAVRVWQEGIDEPIFTLKPSYNLASVWLFPSGAYLASSNVGEDGFVQIWGVNDGQHLQTLDVSIATILWTSDERCIATASFNDPLYLSSRPEIWDMATGELRQTIETETEGIIAWSPDGSALAYLEDDGAIHVWAIP